MKNVLTSQLQKEILRHIILTEKPDYKTIEKDVNRKRETILQSIQALSKKECIVIEPTNPSKKKSKLIFKPTIKGLVIGLGSLDIKFDQIKNNSEKVIDMNIYKEFKENLGVDGLNDILKISSIGLIQFDLIDNNLNQIFSDPYSINKIFLRFLLLSQLTNKDFDIENLFCPPEHFYDDNSKNVVPSKVQEPYKKLLVKLRDNLQKTIDLIPF